MESIYETIVEKMQENFINEYNELITTNTIIDMETITDKEQLNKNIQILEDILSMIKADEVCDKEQMENYENRIKELVDTYSNKVEAIVAEEERIAKEKAEAEKKAKEEAEKIAEEERLAQAEKEQNKNNSNDKPANNGENNSSNNNFYENPNRKKYSSIEEVERLIAEGVITEWHRTDMDDGSYSIMVWYYNYLSSGEILDLRDPVYGYIWPEEWY